MFKFNLLYFVLCEIRNIFGIKKSCEIVFYCIIEILYIIKCNYILSLKLILFFCF